MAQPRVLVLSGYGINCEEETAYAFDYAGAVSDIIHINDLTGTKSRLKDYNIFVFPGGFSYGDDTGSGRALANLIKNRLFQEMKEFVARDTLTLGICNGFQVLVNLGIVPALSGFTGQVEASLEHNSSFRYQCRWVNLSVESPSRCVFTEGISSMHIPVAHGEGRFYAPPETLEKIESEKLVTMRYSTPAGKPAGGDFPANPNGSLNDIAAVCDTTGRVMGMMPHPERGIFFTQRDDWTLLKEEYRRSGSPMPVESDGITIFRNAVKYFS